MPMKLADERCSNSSVRGSVTLEYYSPTKTTGDMISQDVLPEGLMARCLDILRKLSPNERDLIRLVVEVIHELRDPEEEEPMVSSISHAT